MDAAFARSRDADSCGDILISRVLPATDKGCSAFRRNIRAARVDARGTPHRNEAGRRFPTCSPY
jgi:hypothetical protein